MKTILGKDRGVNHMIQQGGRALLVSGLVLLAACSGESPDTLLASAKKHIDNKDSKAAVIQLKNALQKDPSLPEARFLLGKLQLESGDVVGANVELQKAQERGYDADKLAPTLAKAMLAAGEVDKLIKQFADRTLPQAKAQSELRLTLASAYLSRGRLDEGRAALAEALRSDPANISAQLLQVRMLASTKDLPAAKDYLAQVIKTAPTNSEAWQIKGDLLLAERDPEAALAAYREALQRDKANLAAHGAVIGILLGRKDAAGAQVQLDAMRSVAPNSPLTRFNIALLALEKGDTKAVLDETQQLLKRSPNDLRVLQLAGAAELRRGAFVQAQANFNKALKLAPGLVRVRLMLAQTYLRMDEPTKVVKLLQPLVGAEYSSPDAHALTAQAWLMQGEPEKAETHFAAAARLNPQDTRSRTALALAQVNKGHTEQGLDDLKALSLADTGSTADLALISTYLRKKDYDNALKAIDRLETKQPAQATASILRGQVELQRGRREQARVAFDAALKLEPASFAANSNLAALDIADGKPELARTRFEKMVEAEPTNVRAYMALLSLRSQQGAKKDELIALASRAVKANSGEVMPRLALLRLQFDPKDAKPALATAQDGVAAFPDNPEMLDALAQIQLASGDRNQAVDSYNKLAALQPNSPQPFMRLGEFYLGQKDLPLASQNFKKALSIKPDFVPAQRGLITTEMASGRHKEALVIARAMQGQRDNQPLGHVLEGDIQSSQKSWPAAVSAYRLGFDKRPSTEVAIKLHRSLLAAGKADDAQKIEQAWLKQHEQDAAFVYYLADTALTAEKFELALKRYQIVLQLQPENAAALNNAAWLLNRAKLPDALKYAQKAVQLAPKEPAFMDTLAEIYVANGQTAKALEIQKAAVAGEPGNPEHRLHLARIYLAVGDKQMARQELVHLMRLGDKFVRQTEVSSMMAEL